MVGTVFTYGIIQVCALPLLLLPCLVAKPGVGVSACGTNRVCSLPAFCLTLWQSQGVRRSHAPGGLPLPSPKVTGVTRHLAVCSWREHQGVLGGLTPHCREEGCCWPWEELCPACRLWLS